MTWRVTKIENGEMHVFPVDDLRPHHLAGPNCWCKPVQDEEGIAWIHNSMDRREFKERGEEKVS